MKLRESLLLFAMTLTALAQDVPAPLANHWRAFTKTDGLSEKACTSVTIGASGNVLVRHAKANSLSVLDGYEVANVPAPGPRPSRVYESPGGQLWTVAREGLEEFRDGEWVLHRVPEIAEHFRAGFTNGIPLFPVRQGRVLVLLPARLLQLDAEDPEHTEVQILLRADQTKLGAFTALSLARDGGLWISGSRGIAKVGGPLRNLKPDLMPVEVIPPADLQIQDFLAVQENETGDLSVLAKSAASLVAVLARCEGQHWTVLALNVERLRFAWRASGKTWVATSDSLFEWRDDQSKAVANEEISVRRIYDVAVEPGGAFWLATSDGLFRHAPAIWETPAERRSPNRPGLNSDSEVRADREIGVPISLPNEIVASDEWKTFFTAKNGDVWLGGAQTIAWRHQNSPRGIEGSESVLSPALVIPRGEWQFFSSTNEIGPENVIAFAEAPDGRVRCATPNKVWEFDGKNWLILRGGFDRINAMHCARDGTLWVATDNGLHRLSLGAWIANGPEDGLPSSVVREVSGDDFGRISANTSRGVSGFHPNADTDPPRTFIHTNTNAEQSFREGKAVTLAVSGRDKWKLTAAGRLLFSYRLDEREWSPFQELREVPFADLPVGMHYFQVRAMDRNGNIDPNLGRLEFSVTIPWYREARLIVIAFTGMAVAMFFATVAFNRHRLLRHSYAEVERKIAERTRELELANRGLLHSQKMNALGTLAAGIAHDFNNILSIVKGSAQIIEENLGNPAKVRTRLDRIKTVVQQGAGIVEAMLGFSRSSEERAEPCDMNAVADDTITLLGDRFLREVEVRFERGTDLPEVSAARDFIQQVLLNFIFNAAEAMERRSPDRLEPGGSNDQRADREFGASTPQANSRKQVTIATQQLAVLPAGMVLPPARAASYVAISVKDSGSGISPENLPRVFEPFFTTKALSTRRGTGLGLSMVYELARNLEAGLSVESIVGQGSTFTLILPIRDLPAKPKPEAYAHHVS